jgi:hypothetical protein
MHDASGAGGELELPNVVDALAREALAVDVDQTVSVLERLAGRPAPLWT